MTKTQLNKDKLEKLTIYDIGDFSTRELEHRIEEEFNPETIKKIWEKQCEIIDYINKYVK